MLRLYIDVLRESRCMRLIAFDGDDTRLHLLIEAVSSS
jgi:hypothetical protein